VSEPEWVYRQRRQRAAVAVAMVFGAIAMLVVFGPALSGGFDLDGRSHVAIDQPDPDKILAREQREIEAAKQRKAERREERAERRARPKRKPKAAHKPKTAPAPAPASTPAPSPAPAPAAPDPASAPAPPLPQPSQPSGGAVDPRFY
jgi:outer membrane biosynthesis protein TonB